MTIGLWGMGLAQGAVQGTTVPTTATVGGSALDAGTQAEETSLDSLLNELSQMHQNTQSHLQAMQAQLSAQNAWPTSQNTQSMYQQLFAAASASHTTSINSYMNTKTKPEPLPAYKPATLTLTGWLKPSTLTGVPQAKSARSTKPKKISTFGDW